MTMPAGRIMRKSRAVAVAGAVVVGVAIAAGAPSGAVTGQEVAALGSAESYGSPASLDLGQPLIDIVATESGRGYWLAARDGGVFSYGDAPFLGSMGGIALNQPVVAMAAAGGPGYWLVAGDGGVFSFGVPFLGSAAELPLEAPIVDMAATPTGEGYWLLAADGGIFAYGDAGFFGNGRELVDGDLAVTPAQAIEATSTGRGYWIVTRTGGVATFGDASAFPGPDIEAIPTARVVDMAADDDGSGFWFLLESGDVVVRGSAENVGEVERASFGAVAGMALVPGGDGYWIVGGQP